MIREIGNICNLRGFGGFLIYAYVCRFISDFIVLCVLSYFDVIYIYD